MNDVKTPGFICSFDILIFSERPSFYPRAAKLSVYPEYLVISQRPELKITYPEIRSLGLKESRVCLQYEDKELVFIIPSTLEGVTEVVTTELFIELVNSLKSKEYVPTIIQSIKTAAQERRRVSLILFSLIVVSTLLFILGLGLLGCGKNVLGVTLLWLSGGFILAILPVALPWSLKDILFQNKMAKISFHYHLADHYLTTLERRKEPQDEEIKVYYLGKAMAHLEKIIELDVGSEHILELRKRMFPEKYKESPGNENA